MLIDTSKLIMDNIENKGTIVKNESNSSHATCEETPDERKKKGNLCRLCAKRTENTIFIYSNPGCRQHLAYKINAYLPVTVNKTDTLPKQLCLTCVNKLQIISEFAEMCLRAEEELMMGLKPKLLRPQSTPQSGSTTAIFENNKDAIALEPNVLGCEESLFNIQSDETILSKNVSPIFHNSIPCPLCCTGNMILQESEPSGERDTKCTTSSSGEFRELSVGQNNPGTSGSMENNYLSKNKDDCPNEKERNMEIGKNGEDVLETVNTQLLDTSAMPLTGQNMLDIINVSNAQIWNGTVEITNLYLPTQKTSGDFRVISSGQDVSSLDICNENITNTSHSSNETTVCYICEDVFENIELCLKHCKVHTDGKIYCSTCHINFNSESEWKNHMKGHINTVEDMENNYLCQGCNEIFVSFKDLNSHSCSIKERQKGNECEEQLTSQIELSFHQENLQEYHPFKCSICSQASSTIPEYATHIESHQLENGLFCEYCMKTFTNKSDFISHLQKAHVNIPQYNCEVCGEKLANQLLLQNHYATHMNVKPFQCDFCGVILAKKASLHQHLLSHHAKLLPPQPCFKCNVCQETFTNIRDSVTHSSLHTSLENQQNHEIEEVHVAQLYMCEYCESCFVVKAALFEHYLKHSKSSRYICRTCNATFASYGRLSKHKLMHYEQAIQKGNRSISEPFMVPKLFVCQECDKCFPHWSSICYHRRNRHQNNQTYLCKICNESFSIYGEYQEHRKIHPAQLKTEGEEDVNKEFICDYCGKAFSHRSTLALHHRVHLEIQPYNCEICGESFRLKSTYDKHFRKHTGVKPYVCDVCGKGFTQNSGLYTHRRVHTGEKPYSCDLCGKNFRLKHDRDNHRRCHTGERPYQCSYCAKAFRTSHDHRQHLLIHTGQRPYRCDYCGKGFRRINGLNVHKRIHTGEKPYGCEMCGRHFTQKGDMMKHRKTQHGNM